MNKFLKDILFFLVLVMLTYPIFIILMGEVAPKILQKNLPYELGSYGHLHTRIKEAKEYGDVDVLILGSSHAYRGIDPRILEKGNIRSFNLGSSAQSPIQGELLLKRYFDDLNPKLVIVEVYPATLCGDGLESSLDLIANDELKSDYVEMLFQIPNLKLFNSLIYTKYRQTFRGDLDFEEKKRIKDDVYISGGFVEKEMKTFKYTKSEGEKSKWKFNPTQLKALNGIIEYCESKSAKVILIQAPITNRLYANYSNNEAVNKELKKMADYYDFNLITNLDDSLHFCDPHHLNQRGVEIFNLDLLTYLSKHLK